MARLNNITLSSDQPVKRSLGIGPYEEFWTVMKDPEDNGFCVS